MKKMLYFMGVEWNWIFQRPHILARQLEEEYEVTVVCPKQLIHPKHQNNEQPYRLIELLQIPFQEKVRLIGKAANLWHRYLMGNLNDYDLIWVGYPLFGRYIPENYRGIVIYDCMDNFEALYPDRKETALKSACEEEIKLLSRADIVLVSSLKLKEKMLAINPDKPILLVRNGFSNILTKDPKQKEIKEQYVLGYVGTISEWFDNHLIEESLKKNKKVCYELAGPISNHREILSQKVNYCGVIEHAKLGEFVKKIDCLIMPFLINEIILYVDPVKLYEYIAWGKCIISSWYPEIDRFQDYVYFYHNEQEYVDLLEQLCEEGFPAKFTKEQQREFLRENTWEARGELISEALKTCEKDIRE